MKASARGKTIASVLLVVFVLSTAWAAYYLYAEVHPTTSGATTTVATYSESGTNSFVAALSPSYLYNNTTVVYGGNVTLFTPITNWINVTLVDLFSANRSVGFALNETFTVALSTPVWSKTIYTATNRTTNTETPATSIVNRFDVNVSEVTGLASAIDRQIDFTGSSFTLSLDPQISGFVSVGSARQPVVSEPRLNFTFQGSLISPSGLAFSSGGEVVVPVANSSATGVFATAVPVAALATSVGGLGGSIWYVSRRPEEKVVLPLPQMIAPYEEAIAATQAILGPSDPIRVDDFSDLVKIADTLGKPILRPTGGPAPDDSEFIVLDGDVAYSYHYPGSAPPGPSSTAGPEGRPSWAARPATASQRRLVRNLRQELYRLRDIPVDRRTATTIRSMTEEIVAALGAGDDGEAAVKVDELTRLIDRVVSRSSGAGRFARRPP